MAIQDSILATLNISSKDSNPPYSTSNAFNQIITAIDSILGGGEYIYRQAPSADTTGQTISSISVTSGIATVTTAAPHGLLAGGEVKLIGQTPNTYIGLYTISTVPSTTTYTFPLAVANGSATVVGTYTAAPITAGQVIENEYSVVSGVYKQNFRVWDGASNTGKNLAVAVVTAWANEWFYGKIQGLAVVQATGTISVGPVYYSANGNVRSTATASKQILGAEFVYAGAVSNTASISVIFPNPTKKLPTQTTTLTIGAGRTLVYLNRPKVQSALT